MTPLQGLKSRRFRGVHTPAPCGHPHDFGPDVRRPSPGSGRRPPVGRNGSLRCAPRFARSSRRDASSARPAQARGAALPRPRPRGGHVVDFRVGRREEWGSGLAPLRAGEVNPGIIMSRHRLRQAPAREGGFLRRLRWPTGGSATRRPPDRPRARGHLHGDTPPGTASGCPSHPPAPRPEGRRWEPRFLRGRARPWARHRALAGTFRAPRAHPGGRRARSNVYPPRTASRHHGRQGENRSPPRRLHGEAGAAAASASATTGARPPTRTARRIIAPGRPPRRRVVGRSASGGGRSGGLPSRAGCADRFSPPRAIGGWRMALAVIALPGVFPSVPPRRGIAPGPASASHRRVSAVVRLGAGGIAEAVLRAAVLV